MNRNVQLIRHMFCVSNLTNQKGNDTSYSIMDGAESTGVVFPTDVNKCLNIIGY